MARLNCDNSLTTLFEIFLNYVSTQVWNNSTERTSYHVLTTIANDIHEKVSSNRSNPVQQSTTRKNESTYFFVLKNFN